MKKNIIIILCIVVLIISVFIAYVLLNQKETLSDKNLGETENIEYKVPENTVVVPALGNTKELYEMFKVEINDYSYDIFSSCASFKCKKTLDELVEINKKDYIQDFVFRDGINEYDAKLFLNNNNYYVIYYTEFKDETYTYIAKSCCSSFSNVSTYMFFCPIETYISDMVVNEASKNGINILDDLYDNYTFDDACTFYERLSNNMVNINKNSQKINVYGFSYQGEQNMITLNFKDKTVSFIDAETGEVNTYSGNEKNLIK